MVVLLLLTIILSSCSKKERVAENVEKLFLENDCTNFFYNLDMRFPENAFGSCGYVAVSMLLDYYDTLYDETIIDDIYEETPYGLKRHDIDEMKKITSVEYYDYLLENKNEYFQDLLITESNKLYNLYKPNHKNPGVTYEGSSSRITDYYAETHAILDNYLYNIKKFDNTYITTNRVKGDNVRDDIVGLIKDGIPVMVSCKYNGDDGHVLILYDYDEKEDELYGNILLYNNSNHIKISSYWNTMYAPIYITINRVETPTV